MPTGYTYVIEEKENVSFREFALGCARAFGACIDLKDEPIDSEIPEKFTESSYHRDKYNELILDLKKYENMDERTADKKAEEEYLSETNSRKDYLDVLDEIEKKYKAMMVSVEKWNPPTPDHIKLKNFMIQQLDISMDKGSMRKFYEQPDNKIIKLTGQQWLFSKIEKIKKEIEYQMHQWIEETEITEGRNTWIKQLRDSLDE